MAQGKLKVKAKLPDKAKSNKSQKKGPQVSKRANRPIAPKKKKFQEAHKIKKTITKMVNQKMEQEMRARSGDTKKNYSKVEQAVAAYNITKQNTSK